MPPVSQNLTSIERKRFQRSPVRCVQHTLRITSLADYLAVLSDATRSEDVFWFRGHEDVMYSLTPSALRYPLSGDRQKALELMSHFKRIADIKLPRPPSEDRELEWSLIAQHYGLLTRLLDWTESATTALYFACLDATKDGIVYVLNPVALNRLSYPNKPRILDPHLDSAAILAYLRMGPKATRSGRYPLAINPVWNSDRLMLQKGVFTLHGRRFSLDSDARYTMAAIPVLKESKLKLMSELQRIGVDELTLFPELEHSCAHLIRMAKLPQLRR